MDSSLIIVGVVVVIAVAAFFLMVSRKTQGGADEEKLQGFPYEVKKHFLSPAELSFFHTLRTVVDNRAVICSKVRLGDVFWVILEDKSKLYSYRNKIDRKHVDFLLCDSSTMQPIMGVELDDKSHERPDRQDRDAFVDQVFKAANLPLLHVPVKQGYVVTELAAQLAPFLDTVPEPQKTTTPTASVTKTTVSSSLTNEPPTCSKCGSAMVLRTVKNGANAGSRFWGCSNYPTCRSMLPYSG